MTASENQVFRIATKVLVLAAYSFDCWLSRFGSESSLVAFKYARPLISFCVKRRASGSLCYMSL